MRELTLKTEEYTLQPEDFEDQGLLDLMEAAMDDPTQALTEEEMDIEAREILDNIRARRRQAEESRVIKRLLAEAIKEAFEQMPESREEIEKDTIHSLGRFLVDRKS